ncbi:MAG: SIMPL domain-containing protein [Acidobacteriota bacterium]
MKPTLSAVALSLLTSLVMHGQGVSAPPPPPPPLTETQVLVAGQNVIIVSGTGSVALAPDVVSIDLGVSTSGPTVRKIVDENKAKVARIVAILKTKGVRPEQIKTSRFDLRPVEREGVRTGYEVSNTVGVSSRQVADVGALLDAAIDSGANEIRGARVRSG